MPAFALGGRVWRLQQKESVSVGKLLQESTTSGQGNVVVNNGGKGMMSTSAAQQQGQGTWSKEAVKGAKTSF